MTCYRTSGVNLTHVIMSYKLSREHKSFVVYRQGVSQIIEQVWCSIGPNYSFLGELFDNTRCKFQLIVNLFCSLKETKLTKVLY